MLRVGLTGGLGSGKTTVAAIFQSLGAYVVEADAIAREFMAPGHVIYNAIVQRFGKSVVRPDCTLDRRLLADLAFRHNRLAELNQIVHPLVVAAQQEWADTVFAKDPQAVVIVESALIFEVDQGGSVPGWRQRFNRVVLVTAPMEHRIARYVDRMSQLPGAPSRTELETDAESRIAAQLPDSEKIPRSDFVIHNDGSLEDLRRQTERVFAELNNASRISDGTSNSM
jgi:dephospho-CoA kinase